MQILNSWFSSAVFQLTNNATESSKISYSLFSKSFIAVSLLIIPESSHHTSLDSSLDALFTSLCLVGPKGNKGF